MCCIVLPFKDEKTLFVSFWRMAADNWLVLSSSFSTLPLGNKGFPAYIKDRFGFFVI